MINFLSQTTKSIISYPNFVAVLRNKPISKNELEIANGKENTNKTHK
ncbi:MAG: hypothetical protein IPQ19_01500 [Bacteroidetes bacterium]|nr:hypothetical protein [Bacteroidota bacterium]